MIFDPDDPAQAEVIRLREELNTRTQRMAAQGLQIQFDRAGALLEFLLDHVAGASPERIEFERAWSQSGVDQLEAAEQQVRQARLTQGIAMDPRVVTQMRQNGAGN
jgi:hypothetical protein